MLAPCHCEISGFRRSSHWPSKHLNRSGPPPPPPLHRGFSKTMQAWLQAWLREPHGVVNCWQLTTPCRPPPLRVGVRLGHRACGPTAAPLAAGERLKARGNLACGEDFHHCERKTPGRTPGSNCLVHSEGFTAPSYHRSCAGSAPPPMVESSAVLRHVLGSIRKEKLMDTQTVIAVCELLLVVIGIVSLARKDE